MVRQPVVSGRFYPSEPSELLAVIEECSSQKTGAKFCEVEARGELRGLVMPHAGYVFSGPMASIGIKRLSLEKVLPSRILILGPKHTFLGAQASVAACNRWKTPLGDVEIDVELRDSLVKTGSFSADDSAHLQEHSIEVQLPFLQNLYGDKPFRVVPLALGFTDLLRCCAWACSIREVLAAEKFKDVFVLVSSDFSHETPRDRAYKLDSEAIALIEQMDSKGFYDLVVDENRSICGLIPITVCMEVFKPMKVQARKLSYCTSMDIMNHPRGVGYSAIAFEKMES